MLRCEAAAGGSARCAARLVTSESEGARLGMTGAPVLTGAPAGRRGAHCNLKVCTGCPEQRRKSGK